MKKCSAFILALLFLASSTGTTIHVHYCMGKLISAGLWTGGKNQHTCSHCGMPKKKGCCDDTHRIFKSDSQFENNSTAISFFKYLADPILFHNSGINPLAGCDFIPGVGVIHPPPKLNSLPLYISNRSIRI